jgi:hypothetical protein
MLKTRTSAFFSLLLVFVSGSLVGIVGDRLYNTTGVVSPARPRPNPNPEERRKAIIEEMRKEVNLDARQVGQLQQIYDRTREQFMTANQKWNAESRALWDNQRDEIRNILRTDQLPLFEKLTEKHDAERKKKQQEHPEHRKGGPDMPPPPPPAQTK